MIPLNTTFWILKHCGTLRSKLIRNTKQNMLQGGVHTCLGSKPIPSFSKQLASSASPSSTKNWGAPHYTKRSS